MDLDQLVREGNKWIHNPDLPVKHQKAPTVTSKWNVRIAYSQYDRTFTVNATSEGASISKALGMCSRATGNPIPLIQHLMNKSNFRPKPERL